VLVPDQRSRPRRFWRGCSGTRTPVWWAQSPSPSCLWSLTGQGQGRTRLDSRRDSRSVHQSVLFLLQLAACSSQMCAPVGPVLQAFFVMIYLYRHLFQCFNNVFSASVLQVLAMVSLKDGDKSLSLPSLNVEHNYSQILSELVIKLWSHQHQTLTKRELSLCGINIRCNIFLSSVHLQNVCKIIKQRTHSKRHSTAGEIVEVKRICKLWKIKRFEIKTYNCSRSRGNCLSLAVQRLFTSSFFF
jgi:hypothetical protein